MKKYRAEQVEEEKLEQILQAGSYAACGMGKQAGKIVVLQDPADIAQLEKLNAQILGNPDLHPFYGAPTVCVVFADTSVDTWVEDGSLVIGNMLAAAHSLGVGNELHGVMNYPFRTALLTYLKGGDAAGFMESMETLRENYPPEAFYANK